MATNEHSEPRAGTATARIVFGLSAVFVVSGVCGLIYESIWSHYLKLFVGHAAYAQTVVLVVFIGGMAIGAWLVARRAERIRSPLAAYALAEAVIGLVSLVFHPIFVASTDWAYESLLPAMCVPESPCAAQWAFAAALILPQSILLGATFPLMTSGVLRLAPQEPGRRIALLYFLNSIGAAVGVLLAGFVLIPALGLPGTLFTAGLMNIGVALAAWAVAKHVAGRAAVPAPERRVVDASGSRRRWLIVVAALTGLSSFVYEIIWIRMLALVVGASTHSFELMLAAFIFGLAMGGFWVRRRIDAFRDLIRALAFVQILMGVAAVATLALYDGMFDFMAWLLTVLRRGEPGYAVYNIVNHGLALAIMLPATFLAGMTFPLITTALLRGPDGERAIGYTYAANTLGSIVGVILAVHFALPVLGIKGGLLFGAGIDVALGMALLGLGLRRSLTPALMWGAAATLLLFGIAVAAPVLPERIASGVYRTGRAMLEANRSVLFHRDGKTASVTVVQAPEHVMIATNGKPDASIAQGAARPTFDELTMVTAALLPLAFRPDAKTAAVIGFGSGMTTTALLGSPAIERVDTIEIEPRMVEGARLFGEIVAPAFDDPRSRIVIDDAKSYFARNAQRYDVIVSEPSNPWVSGVASLFTQEFYARVKRQLHPDGVFVQWIQAYEFNDRLLATILRALDAEFGDYAVYAPNDGDYIIVAAPRRLAQIADGHMATRSRLQPLAQRLRLTTLDELEARRIAGKSTIRPLLDVFGGGLNSDYFPVVDQNAPKARFAAETASGLMQVAVAGVPIVEMLEGFRMRPLTTAEDPIAPPMRLTMLRSAAETATFLRTGVSAAKIPAPLPREIGLVRAILWNCASVPPRVNMSELMLDIAEVVNPGLPREQAIALWQLVRSAPCAHRMDPKVQAWLDLFEAVAARDPARMAALGMELSSRNESVRLRAYAVMAAGTGLLAGERTLEAQRFLAASLATLPPNVQNDPVFRLLALLGKGNAVHQAAVLR